MKRVEFKVALDRDTDTRVREWADAEERSRTGQVSILMRRLTELRETNAAELARLGLLDPKAASN